jgi:hypothetical protein
MAEAGIADGDDGCRGHVFDCTRLRGGTG